ncbi:MAG: hypothetical protein LBD23_20525 [Oscillospiraceae bacterium]|jgi:hypothetical protein|nr:hypothetical protein [Oscillospiraceae bacterium]
MNKLITQAKDFFKTAGIDYAVCGGFAFDMFAGKELRPHGDFDIMVFKEDKQHVVNYMIDSGWTVYGRFMEEGKPATLYLFYKIEDIKHSFWDDCKNLWAIKPGCSMEMYKLDRMKDEVYSYISGRFRLNNLDFIEFEIDEREGDDFILQKKPRVTRSMEKAIIYCDGIPYLAPEVVLFYKSDEFSSKHPFMKPKTENDFKTVMPMLPKESKEWLLGAIDTAYPTGYTWLDGLL